MRSRVNEIIGLLFFLMPRLFLRYNDSSGLIEFPFRTALPLPFLRQPVGETCASQWPFACDVGGRGEGAGDSLGSPVGIVPFQRHLTRSSRLFTTWSNSLYMSSGSTISGI